MSLKGGKYIAEGTYGCVFEPAQKCKGETFRRPGVSKLMDRSDAIDEIKEQEKVDKIDPTFEYHLRPPHMCGVDMNTFRDRENSLKDCRRMRQIPDNFSETVLLIMENGGESLQTYNKEKLGSKTSRQKIDYICGMKNLFKGLVDFSKNNFMHLDIKPDNVLYNEETGRFNFIDFGLSNDIKDFVEKKDFLLDYGYFYHPFYMVLLDNIDQLAPLDTEKGQEFVNKLHKITQRSDYVYNGFNAKYLVGSRYSTANTSTLQPTKREYEDIVHRLYEEWKVDISFPRELNPPDELLYDYCKKIDIFSLGIIMTEVYVKCTGKKLSLKETTTDVDPFYIELQPIIRGMLEKYHEDRISPEEAYKAFSKLCDKYSSGSQTTIGNGAAAAAASGSSSLFSPKRRQPTGSRSLFSPVSAIPSVSPVSGGRKHKKRSGTKKHKKHLNKHKKTKSKATHNKKSRKVRKNKHNKKSRKHN